MPILADLKDQLNEKTKELEQKYVQSRTINWELQLGDWHFGQSGGQKTALQPRAQYENYYQVSTERSASL